AVNRLRLDSPSGVEPGTILEIVDGSGAVATTVKVMTVVRATAEVTLDPGVPPLPTLLLTPPQVAAINAVPRAFVARSREFRLSVRLLAPPDPTLPSTSETVLDLEVFRNLSLDPRHSRYVHKIVGDVVGQPRLSDQRPDGESWYVRIHDLAQ